VPLSLDKFVDSKEKMATRRKDNCFRAFIFLQYCSAPEYGRSSVDLTYRSVGTKGKDSQENSQ